VGILSGAMSVRRFRVVGDVPQGFRDVFREKLNEFAFQEPPVERGKEEIEGWVLTQNLLDTDFTDFNRWLYEPYAVFALRVDKKALPARYVRALLQKRCEAWCQERGVERCPASVRTELSEALEDELLKRTLPRVAVTECSWHTQQGFLLLSSNSETVADRFKRRFFQTFGLRLVPWSPLDALSSEADVEAMLAMAPTDLQTAGVS
jgi:DNA recombination-dependent growth factor C